MEHPTEMTNAAEALALLRRRGLVTLTPCGALPSVVETVAGGPVRGSWWAHPRGDAIVAFAGALADSSEVWTTKLVEGKVTFVHRSLWPALLRVVSDRRWRSAAVGGLRAPARRLLRAVERAGELRLDRWPGGRPLKKGELAAARLELEKGSLVLGTEVHTEKGSHATVLRSWSRVVDRALRREAARLSFDEALRAVRGACAGLRSAVEAGMRDRSDRSGRGGTIPDPTGWRWR